MRKEVIGNATLYLGDCLDILPSLPKSAALISDPPYGIDYKPLRGSNGSKMWGDEVVTGDAVDFDPTPFLDYDKVVLWGASAYSDKLPRNYGWLVWDKSPRGPRVGFVYSHCELAWTNFMGRIQKINYEWEGASRAGEPFAHPTQKPVAVMKWSIEQAGAPAEVVDPFMGSGTTGIACHALGIPFTGIEIELKYFDVACQRIEDAQRQERLFA
jgi:site-specific DNA-methyltransferase (adenine-specific)